ncbi:hypothetical protein R1sor_025996 [Riccia sorocarpa]|uniref:NADP-dependent oxidoreductase domain-containing protein n=1 Tax=Riccia sorocarpa TaxID=122646 RepID=A0ABD3GA54_9MARC
MNGQRRFLAATYRNSPEDFGVRVITLLGCMGMSAFYGPPKPDEEMIELIHKLYNQRGHMKTRRDLEHVRAACDRSLKRLGVDYIDLYFQHRVDRKVPIEITVGEMKKLVDEANVKYSGLSEVSAVGIRKLVPYILMFL